MPSPGGASLAAAHRVVDRVLSHASYVGFASEPALDSRLSDCNTHVFLIADHADSAHASARDEPNLAGGQLAVHERSLLGGNLDTGSCAAGKLSAFARLELHVVHHRAQRDLRQRQSIARPDLAASIISPTVRPWQCRT